MKQKQPKPRECGTCDACCHHLAIPPLEKPAEQDCPHMLRPSGGKGCGVYGSRPEPCRVFRCVWLQGAIDGEMRPDRCGVMLTASHPTEGVEQVVVAHELRPGAASDGLGLTLLTRIQRNQIVILVRGEKRTILGPSSDAVHAYYCRATEAEKRRLPVITGANDSPLVGQGGES